MKQFRVVLFLSIPVFFLASCMDTAPEELVTWEKQFDLNVNAEIIQIRSGHFLVNGSRNLIKLDKDGNEIWQLNLSDQIPADNLFINHLIETTDGGFALLGQSEESSDSLVFIMLNDLGDIVTKNVLIQSSYCGESDVTETSDGYRVAISLCPSEGELSIYSFNLDESGKVINENKYAIPGESTRLTGPLLILQDQSGLLISSRLNSTDGGEQNNKWRVTRLNDQMAKVWSTDFGKPVFSNLNAVIETPNGSYLFAGGYQGILGWVVKINSGGSLVWDKTYGTDEPGKSFFFDIKNDTDTGFILAGNTNRKGAGSTDGWVAKIDDSGEMVWDVTHGTEFNDYAWSVTPAHDRGYALTGQIGISFTDPQQLWVLKLDKNGEL